MIEHFTIKDYPYEERRMDFFKQKRLEAKRRMDHWAKRAVNGRYNSIQHEKACDAADEWNFYNDVIVMLGGEDGEQPKLKPCPFCGGEAVIKPAFILPVYIVYCKNCASPLGSFYGDECDAIEAWNRRANDDKR